MVAPNRPPAAIFADAQALVAGHYAMAKDAPQGWSPDTAILIQFSDLDDAWLATLVMAPVPVLLGGLTADGATPAKALAALDDLLSFVADHPREAD